MNTETPDIARPSQPKAVGTTAPFLCGLFEAFQRLDHRLEQAVSAAEKIFGAPAGSDPYRGLYITRDETTRLLRQEPGSLAFPIANEEDLGTEAARFDEGSRLSCLRRAFGLSPLEVDAIVIALAPEIDLRYERLYAYLQDDVTRRRPSVDLVLNLLCASAEEKLQCRKHFGASAPLVRNDLIHLVQDPQHVQPGSFWDKRSRMRAFCRSADLHARRYRLTK